MTEPCGVKIGEICIWIEGRDQSCGMRPAGPAYSRFISSGKADITLRLQRGGIPEFVPDKKVFECPPVWTLYRQNGTSAFRIFGDASYPSGSERVIVLHSNRNDANLYFSPHSQAPMDAFHGPTLELLMVSYLGQGRGAIVHACGVVAAAQGLLFVGESGAGKSTIARLWTEEEGVEVLSDDRIIVRKRGQEFWMYGTPWHGEARFASPRAARVERIFFLRHGKTCETHPLKGIDPVSRFLTASFPPYWDPHGMAFTLDFFSDLTSHVRCEELTFKPDRSVVDLVRTVTP